MFLNLTKGNILYGISTKDNKVQHFTALIDDVRPSLPYYNPNSFGQIPTMTVDITTNINGEKREFKQIPANNAIADFGIENVVLADNKDSLLNHVKTLLQTSENIVLSAETHKALIPQYKDVLNELSINSSNDTVVKELKEEVSSLKAQLAEAISLLKVEANK